MVAAQLKPLTPERVLWDLNSDGRTDIGCPGNGPVLRAVLAPGVYRVSGIIVYADSATTGRYGRIDKTVKFPDDSQTQPGVLRPANPLWCRTSIVPPPDPETGPCATSAVIGRVTLTGNLCPINLRSVDDATFNVSDPGVGPVLDAAAAAINANEAQTDPDKQAAVARHRKPTLPSGHGFLYESLPQFAPRQVGLPAAPGTQAISVALANNASGLSAINPGLSANVANVKTDLEGEVDKQYGAIKSSAVKQAEGVSNFAMDQIYAGGPDLKVNGVALAASSLKVPTLIVPSDAAGALPGVKNMIIASSGVQTLLGGQELDPRRAFTTHVNDAVNKSVTELKNELKPRLNLDDLKDKLPNLGPFKLAGDADIKLNPDGTATIKANARFDGLTTALSPPQSPADVAAGVAPKKGGKEAQIGVTINADQVGNFKLQGIVIDLPSAYLYGIQLTDLHLTYDDNGLNVSGLITFPLLNGSGIQIKSFRINGKGDFAGAEVGYVAGAGQGLQVGPGIFLTKLEGGISLDPIHKVSAGGAVSALAPSAGNGCPTAGIEGGAEAVWEPTPFTVSLNGAVSIACIKFGKVFAQFIASGIAKIDSSVDLNLIGVVKLNGHIGGEIRTRPSNVWQVDAGGSGDIPIFGSGGTKLVLSSRGAAACVKIDPIIGPDFEVGAAEKFTGGIPPLSTVQLIANFDIGFGCDADDYAPIRLTRYRGLDGPQAFTLNSDALRFIKLQGDGAPPAVTLISPSGKRYDYSTGAEHVQTDDSIGGVDADSNQLVVVLTKPEKGQWRIEPAAGSAPILGAEMAGQLPEPKVTGSVRRRGAQTVLRYKVTKVDGQVVDFVGDRRRPASRTIKHVVGGGSGTVAYTPAETTGVKREVKAYVTQDGLPRETVAVAKYSAPNPKLAKPRVRVKLRGKRAMVRWRKVPGAVAYNVRLRYPDGRDYLVKPSSKALAVFAPGARGGVTAYVTALTTIGRQSTGSARLKSTLRPERPKKFKELKVKAKPRKKGKG